MTTAHIHDAPFCVDGRRIDLSQKYQAHARPYLILVVGNPAKGGQGPEITKKPLDEITTFI